MTKPTAPGSSAPYRRTFSNVDPDAEVSTVKRQRRDEYDGEDSASRISQEEAQEHASHGQDQRNEHNEDVQQDPNHEQDQEDRENREDEQEQHEQDQDNAQVSEDELKARWAAVLNEQIEILIARRDLLLNLPTVPSAGQATLVNPSIYLEADQIKPPTLSTNAPDLQHLEQHPDRFALEDAQLDVSITRARLHQIVNDLAGLEANLGTEELDGDFAYNVRRTIEIWRGYARTAFQQMCHEEARVIEIKYAKVYLQGGPSAEDIVKPPTQLCAHCSEYIRAGLPPERAICFCSLVNDMRDHMIKIHKEVEGIHSAMGNPFYTMPAQGVMKSDWVLSFFENELHSGEALVRWGGPSSEDELKTDGGGSEGGDGGGDDATVLEAKPKPAADVSAQRATLLHLARREGTPAELPETTDDGNETDDGDSDMTVDTATMLEAPSIQRNDLLRLARGRS
ncbi:MAG: hypothetical protein Q9213_006840 [Squamulea squamosa]